MTRLSLDKAEPCGVGISDGDGGCGDLIALARRACLVPADHDAVQSNGIVYEDRYVNLGAGWKLLQNTRDFLSFLSFLYFQT